MADGKVGFMENAFLQAVLREEGGKTANNHDAKGGLVYRLEVIIQPDSMYRNRKMHFHGIFT